MKTMTVAEAATTLGVSKSTALRMARARELGPVEKIGQTFVLQASRVEKKAAARQSKTDPKPES